MSIQNNRRRDPGGMGSEAILVWIGIIVVVVGVGSIYAANSELLDRLVAAQTLAASYEGVRIVRATLGPDLLLIGAAELAFEPLIDDPARLAGSVAAPV